MEVIQGAAVMRFDFSNRGVCRRHISSVCAQAWHGSYRRQLAFVDGCDLFVLRASQLDVERLCLLAPCRCGIRSKS